MQLVKPTPFEEAIDKLGRRSPIGSRLSSSEWADVPVALRERAFFSSRVESVRVLQQGRDAIAEFLQQHREVLPGGQTALATGSRQDFVNQMQEFMARQGIERGAGGLTDITSERRLSLIFNVQTQQAQDFGYRKQGLDVDVLNEFPAQRFIRVKPVKEPREYHIQFEDQVYLKTDPIWTTINRDFGVPWGPWGWGCGHDVEDVDRDEAEQLGLIQPGDRIAAPVESFNQDLAASAAGLDQDLLDVLRAEFGDRLSIDGDQIRWNEEAIGREQALAQGPLRQHPVSEAIDLDVYGVHRDKVLAGLGAIEKVHDTAPMPTVPLRDTPQSVYGYLAPKLTAPGVIEADHMAVRSSGPWPSFTSIHEAGHLLDLEAIGARGSLATRSGNPDMLEVLAAAEQTQAVQALRQRYATTTNPDVRDHLAYLLKPEEIWARSYSQFIAARAGYPAIGRELAAARQAEHNRQWENADFGPLAAAVESLLRKQGWL